MDFFNKLVNKKRETFIGFVVFTVLVWAINNGLDWLFSDRSSKLLTVLSYKIQVSVTAIIIGFTVVSVGVYLINTVKISKRRLKVLRATYGANNIRVDITSELNKAVIDNKLKIVISNAIAGDPIPGIVKVASVHYEYAGKRSSINVNEGNVLELPLA